MTTLVVTIVVALIGAFVSFAGIILPKEQKVSEFRQNWLDELRKDISSLLARLLSLHAFHSAPGAGSPMDPNNLAKTKDDYIEINQVSTRVRLRLNPRDPTHQPLIEQLDKAEKFFKEKIVVGNATFDEVEKLTARVTNESQALLKEVWEEIKAGEPLYRVAKWIALVFVVLAFVLLASVAAIQFRTASPTMTTHRCAPMKSLVSN